MAITSCVYIQDWFLTSYRKKCWEIQQAAGQCLQHIEGGMEGELSTVNKALISHLQDSTKSTLNSAKNGQV
jgi:hypothetical protein